MEMTFLALLVQHSPGQQRQYSAIHNGDLIGSGEIEMRLCQVLTSYCREQLPLAQPRDAKPNVKREPIAPGPQLSPRSAQASE
ncbi:MAG: hypothetical protein DMG86_04005 [Acidobacteria bacterium]|nr:MAG: hypothetical protein DMG86_04005 [Acidobacteriota bacterium]